MKPIEKSILQYLREYAAENGEHCFLFDENRRYTARQVYWETIAMGNRLFAMGIHAGSTVALRCTRSLDTCLIYLTLQAMGATVLMTDPHQTDAAFLKEAVAQADFLITNEKSSNDISANGGWEVLGAGALEVGCPTEEPQPLFPTSYSLHQPSTVVFTSGSTGICKGVMLSQYNLINHIRNFSVSGCYFADDVSAELLPIHHVFGLAVILMGLVMRYTIFFPRTVDITYTAACIEKLGITRLDGVPSFALALAQHHRETGFCSDSLRVGVLGGAPSTKSQFDMIEAELGIRLLPVYGQSECIGITGADETQSDLVRSSTVGSFLPMNEGILLDDFGNPVPQGQEGEICVKGPAVMLGYLGDPEGTREAIDSQGRLHTGDLGYLDENGNLHISGRKKEIIIRNGNNLSAGKIEQAVLSLKEVAQAAAVGISHPQYGEVPCVFAVLKPGCALSEAEMTEALKKILSKIEIPEKILFGSAMPLLSSGKTDKQSIKKLFLGQD